MAERVDLEKDHSPQHFRRSSATCVAERPYASERLLGKRYGWSWYSDTPEHYIQTMDEAVEDNVSRVYGHDVEAVEEPPELAPVICPGCEEWTMRGLDSCIWRSHDIDEEIAEIQHTVSHSVKPNKDLLDLIMEGEITADDIRSLRKLEPVIRSRPEVLDELEKLTQLAEGYEQERDGTSAKIVNGVGLLFAWGTAKASDAVEQFVRAKHVAHILYQPSRSIRRIGRRPGRSPLAGRLSSASAHSSRATTRFSMWLSTAIRWPSPARSRGWPSGSGWSSPTCRRSTRQLSSWVTRRDVGPDSSLRLFIHESKLRRCRTTRGLGCIDNNLRFES